MKTGDYVQPFDSSPDYGVGEITGRGEIDFSFRKNEND